jgi:hypothetical protein
MRAKTGNERSDYGRAGISIQAAMVRNVSDHPDRTTRPRFVLWNGQKVWTTYEVPVPDIGRFRIEFLSDPREPLVGVDVKAENGLVQLSGGEEVATLRTWHEPRLESSIEYSYRSSDGRLKVWNVYRRSWPDGRVTDEKWTGNAGFTVVDEGERSFLFRCSDGGCAQPDFGRLVFRFSVSPLGKGLVLDANLKDSKPLDRR